MKKSFYLMCSLAALTASVMLAGPYSSYKDCEKFCGEQTCEFECNDGSREIHPCVVKKCVVGRSVSCDSPPPDDKICSRGKGVKGLVKWCSDPAAGGPFGGISEH